MPGGKNVIDPFLSQRLAFPLEGPDKPEWLDPSLCAGASVNIGGKNYLLGTVVRKERKTNEYLVEWEHTFLGKSTMTASLFLTAIDLANKLKNNRRR